MADSGANKDPLVGRTISEAYVILDLVGVGGMGRVYRAEQSMLGRTVAIKVIHPHLLSDEQSVARFYTEARAASRLNHPNSVSIIDFGRTDDGVLYLVMEYLKGKDLSRLMREDGPLPLARICDIMQAMLAALGEAHALEVIHRDLKPENVIIERLRSGGDLVKVVDFGLAKLLGGGQESPSITLPGLVCGTPDYMSPEQGRGIDVDARGDVYSAGVLLFELLTEQLPFTADTPTNVVLRHIQDPVPDPRDVAPQRNIPQELVDVVLTALSKDPKERFQNAEEMAAALKDVARMLQPSKRQLACPACGTDSPAGKRFCGECGASLQATTPAGMRLSMPPGMDAVVGGVIVGRQPELEAIEKARERADGRFVSVCVVGESGSGKTRLLAEAAERATKAGDLVVGAGPHPSLAPVPYYPIQTVVTSLFGLDKPGLIALAEQEREANPLAAAGMLEVLDPTGLRGSVSETRGPAVAVALALAMRRALEQSEKRRIVLVIDDLHNCDGLTPAVLSALAEQSDGMSILLLTALVTPKESLLVPDTQQLPLRSLSLAEANAFMMGVQVDAPPSEGEDKLFLPLHLDQLRSLGIGLDVNDPAAPDRLADAVLQRVQRLDANARRMLQAAAVIGTRCQREMLERVCGSLDGKALSTVIMRGLLREDGDDLEVVHPFVRDLVEASVPAQARKELHATVLQSLPADDTPLEVRAHHAFGAGEVLSALMLLERMGDLAVARGDIAASVVAYQRGLQLARRELLESGDTSLDEAISSFSRRLGSSLARRGDITGAEGVLREALEFAGPTSLSRAHILIALAEVMAKRNRQRDAYRLLGQALDITVKRDNPGAEAEVQVTMGRIRRQEGNQAGALTALQAAVELLDAAGATPLRRAEAAIELASVLVDSGDGDSAAGLLLSVRKLARDAAAPHLIAKAAMLNGNLAETAGDSSSAESCYDEAIKTALEAGDAPFASRVSQLRAAVTSESGISSVRKGA